METLGLENSADLHTVTEPSRKGRLEAYLWDFGEESSIGIAEDFYDPYRPMADTAVLIPVAAHQEAAKIVPAMAEYARQEDAEPFTIFLLLNYPFDAPDDAAFASIEQVEAAKRQFPLLDIRYSVRMYDTPVIGQIRKDLWDAGLRVALTDGIYDKPGNEVIGINHDIDTESITSHYIRNAQRHYRRMQRIRDVTSRAESPLPSLHTQIKHAYPFKTHPNIARAIFWDDLTYRQHYRGGVYEEGIVVPFSYYAKQRGWDKDAIIREGRRIVPEFGAGILLTGMETSPRRFIMRIGDDSQAEIWTPETFGCNDACRNPRDLPADISHSALEERIFDKLDSDLDYFCAGATNPWRGQSIHSMVRTALLAGDYDEQRLIQEMRGRIDAQMRLARYSLAGVVGSPLLASFVDTSVLDRYTAETADLIREAASDGFALSLS